ncbi:MAG: cell wall-active antibiotics response protein [Melioribacteraceae bacterium]|nr:cell wall-active antibiotics response protein [Melioribacteraceae bacterium]
MNSNKLKNYIGIFFILIGVLWLFENFDLIFFGFPLGKLIFSWHTFAIIFGAILISNNSKSFGGYFFITIGLISLLKHIPFNPLVSFLTFGNLWPLILIGIGIWMIMNLRSDKYENKINFDFTEKVDSTNENLINESVQFTSMKKIINSENFSGGNINVWFGELKLDLTQSKLKEGDNTLNVNIMFGSLELRVPTDWKVNTSISATFGGIDDKRIAKLINVQSNSTLMIKGSVAFGGCEISY